MKWLDTLLPGLELTPGLIATAICVFAGAFVLTNFTRISGIMGFLLNGLVLAAGALAANFLSEGFSVQYDFLLEKTLIVTIGGMLVTSLIMLLLFSRPKRG